MSVVMFTVLILSTVIFPANWAWNPGHAHVRG